MTRKAKRSLPGTLMDRGKAETPKFFKKLRAAGLVVAAVGTAILSVPVSLPAIVVTVGGYLVATGSVLSSVSQLTIKDDKE